MRYPLPFVDEPWFASRAWALIQTGHAFGSLDSGTADTYEGYWTSLPITYPMLQSLVFRVLGLSLFSIRITSLLLGGVLVVAVYIIGNRLYGAPAGLIAAALVALSRSFLASAHLGRPDIMVAALGYFAIALHVTDESKRFSMKAALAGIAVVVAFDAHMNGVLFGFALLALHFAEAGFGMLKSRRFWSYAIGTAAGLAGFAAFHILPYPETYMALNRPGVAEWRPPPLLTWDLGLWLRASLDTFKLLVWSNSVEVLAALVGCVLLVVRRNWQDRQVLALLASMFVAMSLLIRYKFQFYGILISPTVDLIVACLLTWIVGRRWLVSRLVVLKNATILGVVVGGIFLNLRTISNDPMPEYQATLATIGETVPDGASVLGVQTYWLALPDHRYIVPETLAAWPRFFPGSDVEDGLRALHPDYLILDNHVSQFIVDDRDQLSEYFQFLYIPKHELVTFLDKQAELARTVETDIFGDVRVYRIDWAVNP